MKSTVSFQALLQRFFTNRLMQQRQASAHTISSYRDTFRLLLRFAHKRLHKTPDQLAFEDIDAPLVAAFLNDLEKTRDIGTRTRNLRLTAIAAKIIRGHYKDNVISSCFSETRAVHWQPQRNANDA